MPKTTKIKGGKFKLPQKGPYKVHNFLNDNIVELTTLGDHEVERININKLKEYHSKSVVANIMACNVHVKRYPNNTIEARPQLLYLEIHLGLSRNLENYHGQIP
jgi:hypothetical protein